MYLHNCRICAGMLNGGVVVGYGDANNYWYLHSAMYRKSLADIKEAVISIWDEPLMVKDGTDHGVRHSEEIIKYLAKLLLNSHISLTEDEKFMLLCSAYLHDIGLQVDIGKLTCRCKDVPTKVSAQTEDVFTANTQYQKLIRELHNRLTAAIILRSICSDDTLSKALVPVSPKCVMDIVDICRFHSKSNIEECPDSFMGISSNRKRFIAALLRFADELDFKAGDVDHELIKRFGLTPGNKLSWWLLKRLTVSVQDLNGLKITASVNKTDFENFKTQLLAMIREIWQKNFSVISVLQEHGLTLSLTDDSGAIIVEESEDIPEFIAILLAGQ